MADQQANAPQQQWAVQRIYVKDLSFEAPLGAKAFTKQWEPQTKVDLNIRNAQVDADHYEVVLAVTITASLDGETVFLIEVQQAGVFLVKGFDGELLRQVLAIGCPNMLFPYARETIDSVVVKGSFPAVNLQPVAFDALYQQAQKQQMQPEAAH